MVALQLVARLKSYKKGLLGKNAILKCLFY